MLESSQREREVFFRAFELSDLAERENLIADSCGNDGGLRQRVKALLAAHDIRSHFLDSPVIRLVHLTSQPSDIQEGLGSRIDNYELMEKIGEGAFGVVFSALQSTPVARNVAIKIIKPGMNSKEVVSRFRAEQQALAIMDHPNIARIFDAGTTPSGLPYFVMELVRGLPIDEFCDQHRLEPRSRLELFVTLCHAVQHAHQKGIIHRDLKPSNVLVTLYDNMRVVKVIDFGIAKALDGQLTDQAVQTHLHQLVGTPLYMSPEQAELSGIDIDTRADVYSLGVVLYKLLTGSTPFNRKQFANAAWDEIRRIIREVNPPKPSTRLSQSSDQLSEIAVNRQIDAAKLVRLIHGDLDWITMRALEKERSRRYESADAFAKDLQRYLNDEVVEARPPSTSYRLLKFSRQHRGLIRLASVATTLLIAGALSSTWFALNERQARKLSDMNFTRAKRAENVANLKSNEAEESRIEVDNERRQANLSRQAADRSRDESDWRLYIGSIAQAQQSWRNGDVLSAWTNLDACRWDLRGWEYNYLYTSFSRNHHALLHNQVKVTSLQITPDGRHVLCGDAAGTVCLWSLDTGQKVRELCRRNGIIDQVSTSPDGSKYLAVCESEQVSLVWDADTGVELDQLQFPDGRYWKGVLDRHGERLFLASEDGTCAIWSTKSNALEHSFNVPSGSRCIAVDSDRNQIAIAHASGGVVSVWNTSTALQVASWPFTAKCLTFSPDGQLLVCGDATGRIQIVRLLTGEEMVSWDASAAEISSLAFNFKGEQVASGDSIGNIRVWNVADASLIRKVRVHNTAVSCLEFHQSVPWIISGSYDHSIQCVTANNPSNAQTLVGHSAKLADVSFSRDSQKALTVGKDNKLIAWEVATAKAIREITQVQGQFTAATFLPDSQHVLSGDSVGDIKRWSLSESEGFTDWLSDENEMAGSESRFPIKTLACHPGQDLILCLRDQPPIHSRATIYRAQSGGKVSSMGPLIRWARFLPRESQVLSNGQREAFARWNCLDGKEQSPLAGPPGPLSALAVSPEGLMLLSGSDDGIANLWSATRSPQDVFVTEIAADHSQLTFSTDGQKLLGLTQEGTLVCRSANNGRIESEAKIPAAEWSSSAMSGKWIVAGGRDGKVHVTDQSSFPQTHVLGRHDDFVDRVGISEDGQRAVSFGRDQKIILWDVNHRQPLRIMSRDTAVAQGLALSPDSTRIVVGFAQGHILLIDGKSGQDISRIDGVHFNSLECAVFDKQSNRLAAGFVESNVIIVDALTGVVQHSFQAFPLGAVAALTFNPDGSKLAVGNVLGEISLWNAANGDSLGRLPPRDHAIQYLSFHSSGERLLSTSEGGAIRIWNLLDGSVRYASDMLLPKGF